MKIRVSRWIFVAAISIGVAACVSGPGSFVPIGQNAAAESRASQIMGSSRSGELAVAQLNEWYADTTHDCGSATRPAFLCSGVMLRATDTDPAFLPWDPSPNAVQKGGIAASWLRADTNFPSTVLPNGFIFFPDYDIPTGKIALAILCAFPLDGNTWERPTLQGCGQHRTDPQSRPCHELGITTSQGWIANYNAVPPAVHPTHSHQCGWDVREGSPATSDRFYQNILARAALSSAHWQFVDEVIVQTWPTGVGASLPIQSFFYKSGDGQALSDARNDQQRYFNLYRIALPIIRLTLPSSPAGRAQFAYDPADQVVIPTN
ncbi:hypothetical protein [Luteibacter sp. E-22]|uniref:hypothetical protein n=1 Tax=Luteibacter sp. E-22 TaxID=3404050 RepID=UPI003CF6BBAD